MSNRNSIAVSSKTAGVKIEPLAAEENTYHYSVSVPVGIKSFELTFTMTEDQNARVDNFLLTAPSQETDGIASPLTPLQPERGTKKGRATGVYNLSGQKVSTSKHHNTSIPPSLQGGAGGRLFIVDGKKVIQ